MARHVDKADDAPAGKSQRRKAQLNGDAALFLLGKAVGVNARQRFDQTGFAVIDVAGRSDDQRDFSGIHRQTARASHSEEIMTSSSRGGNVRRCISSSLLRAPATTGMDARRSRS